MTNISKLALAASAVFLLGSAAQAADAIRPVQPVTPIAPMPSSAFDWSGFYAGVNVGGLHDIDDSDTHFTLGGQVGVNAVFDMFVLGAELGLDAVLNDDVFSYGDVVVRAGAIIADPALVYAAIGVGTDFGMPNAAGGVGDHLLAGGGLEFAVTDSVSVDARYMYGWGINAGDDDIHQFGLGVNFHF